MIPGFILAILAVAGLLLIARIGILIDTDHGYDSSNAIALFIVYVVVVCFISAILGYYAGISMEV